MKKFHLVKKKNLSFISPIFLRHLSDGPLAKGLIHGCVQQTYGTHCLETPPHLKANIMDFAKAFDKVPHQWFTQKLTNYGIAGPVTNWVEHFLKERKQHWLVMVNTLTGLLLSIETLKFQWLPHPLSDIYINDLPDSFKSFPDFLLIRQLSTWEYPNKPLGKKLGKMEFHPHNYRKLEPKV